MDLKNFKEINGIRIYYEVHGENTASPLVLIAGFSCDHTFWTPLIDLLKTHHQIVVLDNRGIGQSGCPDIPYSIDMMADDVMALCKQLHLTQPIIVGQSMGSTIAQNIAKRYSTEIQKIILINTFNRLTKLPEIVFELIAEFQRKKLPLIYQIKIALPWVYSNEFLNRPNQIEMLINLLENNPYPQSSIGYQRQLEALKSFDSKPWLNTIKIPACIIAGEADLIAPLSDAKEVQQQLGNHTPLMIVPGGHASPIEQPEKIANIISKFINDANLR